MKPVDFDSKQWKPGPKRHRAPEPWEVKILALISEQVGFPMDLLAEFIGLPQKMTEELMEDFSRRRLVTIKKYLVNDEPWVKLRTAGAKHANTGLRYSPLEIHTLPHRRAICEIRLSLERQYPEGIWICERRLAYRKDLDGLVPDGLFKVRNRDGKLEEWAIEAEISPKDRKRYEAIAADRNFRYDKLRYYTTPAVYRALNRVPAIVDGVEDKWITLKVFFRDTNRVKNFQWAWSKASGPGEAPTYDRVEPWEVEILRLLSEQTAIPIDQLARFLRCEETVAQKVANHLDAAGFVSQGFAGVDEAAWVWVSKTGARLAGTGLPPLFPSPVRVLELRRRNEARLYVMERDPHVRWWGRRLLRRGAEDGRVPLAIVEEGSEQHAVEVEYGKRATTFLVEKYDRRCEEFDYVGVFVPKRRLQKWDSLKARHGWDNLFVYPFDDTNAVLDGDDEVIPDRVVRLYEITLEELPAEALEEVRKAERLATIPNLEWIGRYRGSGFSRWRVVTESGRRWHVSRTPQGWFARPTSKRDEPTVDPETLDERAAPDPEPEPEKRIKGPKRGMKKVSARELPEQALEAIREAAGLESVPEVVSVKQRRGPGFRRWLVATDEVGSWRVSENPQYGFQATQSDGVEDESSTHFRKTRWKKDPPGVLVEIDTWEVPSEAIRAIQDAAELAWPPKVLAAEMRPGKGALRWRLVTEADTWRVTKSPHGWTASLSQ